MGFSCLERYDILLMDYRKKITFCFIVLYGYSTDFIKCFDLGQHVWHSRNFQSVRVNTGVVFMSEFYKPMKLRDNVIKLNRPIYPYFKETMKIIFIYWGLFLAINGAT